MGADAGLNRIHWTGVAGLIGAQASITRAWQDSREMALDVTGGSIEQYLP